MLGNAEETDIDLEGGMLSCIEEKRGCARCKCTFWLLFSIICVLYYRSISQVQAIEIENMTNPCDNPSLGESILNLPFKKDGYYDYEYGELFEIEIRKNNQGVFQIFYDGKLFDGVCFRADIMRGIRLLAEDTQFWRACKDSKAIFTVTRTGEIQYWFTPNHTMDEGATS